MDSFLRKSPLPALRAFMRCPGANGFGAILASQSPGSLGRLGAEKPLEKAKRLPENIMDRLHG